MLSVSLKESCESSEVITVDVPHDGRRHSFRKVDSITRQANRQKALFDVPSESVVSEYGYWYGEDIDGSTFNYVQDADGNMMGSLVDVTNSTVMQFQIEDGVPTVIIRDSSNIPPYLEPPEEYEAVEHDRSLFTTSTMNDRKAEDNFVANEPVSKLPEQTNLFSFDNDKQQESRSLYDDEGGNLDIMVLWTKDAECRNAGLSIGCTLTETTTALMQSRINLAIQETNTAYRLSGIETELLLVHSYRHPTFTSNDNFSGSLSELNSCRMSGVCDNRETYGADLVALLIEGSSYCGVAALGPRFMDSFSVTAWDCATGIFAFGHEIGHNLVRIDQSQNT